MVYKWKRSVFPVSAQVAGECLQDIERENGSLTPALIVDCSRNKSAPLHNCFEWDDVEAAEEYRKVQAREMLRFLVVVKEEEPEPVRAFLRVKVKKDNDNKSVYLSTDTVMNNDEYRLYVLREALSMMENFKKKYAHLKELSAVINEMDRAEKQMMAAV